MFLSGVSDKKKSHSFSKRSLTDTQKLVEGFNFTFAGACNIFISKNKTKYVVSWIGFDLAETIVFFNKNAIGRCQFDTLYKAIQYFIYLINMVTQDLTWYKPEIYEDSDSFYEFAHSKVYE